MTKPLTPKIPEKASQIIGWIVVAVVVPVFVILIADELKLLGGLKAANAIFLTVIDFTSQPLVLAPVMLLSGYFLAAPINKRLVKKSEEFDPAWAYWSLLDVLKGVRREIRFSIDQDGGRSRKPIVSQSIELNSRIESAFESLKAKGFSTPTFATIGWHELHQIDAYLNAIIPFFEHGNFDAAKAKSKSLVT